MNKRPPLAPWRIENMKRKRGRRATMALCLMIPASVFYFYLISYNAFNYLLLWLLKSIVWAYYCEDSSFIIYRETDVLQFFLTAVQSSVFSLMRFVILNEHIDVFCMSKPLINSHRLLVWDVCTKHAAWYFYLISQWIVLILMQSNLHVIQAPF